MKKECANSSSASVCVCVCVCVCVICNQSIAPASDGTLDIHTAADEPR